MSTERICPVGACGKPLGVGPKSGVPRLICSSHWHMVPNKLALRIVRLDRLIRTGSAADVAVAWPQLKQALTRAIAAAERGRPRRRVPARAS